MKRVLFVISNLNCGGINRALENLFEYCRNDYTVDILALDSSGIYNNIFNGPNLICSPLLIDYQARILNNQKGLSKIICLLYKCINRISLHALYKFATNRLQDKISKHNYDSVIAFSEGLPTYFVAPIKTNNKVAWIHCDYKSYLSFSPSMKSREEKIYALYDKIVCVSRHTRDSFVEVYVDFSFKTEYVYNLLNIKNIKTQAGAFVVEEYLKNDFNIVTIGRIDPVKCPSRIPTIAAKIKSSNFKWFIIGPTIWQSEYNKLVSEINRLGLQDKIILLGEKSNPYPYIKQASLLVNTSLSEACPYVINEAKVLETPVVCTDFGSAQEFINNGIDGYTVPLNQIANVINSLIENSELYYGIKEALNRFEYTNKIFYSKIFREIL